MSLTSLQKVLAILEDREATAEEEGRLREQAQAELALAWKQEYEARQNRGAA